MASLLKNSNKSQSKCVEKEIAKFQNKLFFFCEFTAILIRVLVQKCKTGKNLQKLLKYPNNFFITIQ